MSELNNAIKPWLLANGFEKIEELSHNIILFGWDYKYSNGKYYIYFDEDDEHIKSRHHNGNEHKLYHATADEVIAYFIKYGNTPQLAPSTTVSTDKLFRCTSNGIDITARCIADDLLAIELINNGWHTEIKLNKQQAGQLAQYLVAFACSPDIGVVKE